MNASLVPVAQSLTQGDDKGLIAQVKSLRDHLDKFTTIDDLKEAADRLQAVEAYASAKRASEVTVEALISQAWIERKAGEVALAEHSRDPREWAGKYGISVQTAKRWLFFAHASQDEFATALGAFSHEKYQYRLNISYLTHRLREFRRPTTHPEISQLIDGSFLISYERDGKRDKYRLCGLEINTLAKAARELKLERERDKRERELERQRAKKKGAAGLDVAYGKIRESLQAIDAVLNELPNSARASAESAMTHLYKAEDLVSAAGILA